MPKISVIIPTYNCADYICETIDSVLYQTYKDFEIIVVDDGSFDNTKDKIAKYNGKIRYIYQSNNGPSAARNIGINEAKGKYIAFLDADDLWFPKKLELQVNFLDKYLDFGLVTCDALAFENSRVITSSMAKERRLYSGWVLKYLLKENFLNTDNVLIRRECLDKVGLFDEKRRYSEDYDLWLRIAKYNKIGYIDDILTKYRVHKSSNSQKNKIKFCNAHLELVFSNLKGSELNSWKIHTIVSHNYYKIGYNFFNEYNLTKARKYLFLCILNNPFKLKSYMYLVCSFFSKSIIDLVKRLKRLMKISHKTIVIGRKFPFRSYK